MGGKEVFALWLVVMAGCAGQATEGTPPCAKLCELKAGCGYSVETCTERCDVTLQESPCEGEARELFQCLMREPSAGIECVEIAQYQSFEPVDRQGPACREAFDKAYRCGCDANELMECL